MGKQGPVSSYCCSEVNMYKSITSSHYKHLTAVTTFLIILTVQLYLTKLRLLFIVFFVPICIDGYIFSVHRKTKLFGGMEGP